MNRDIESGECFTALITFKNINGKNVSQQDNENGKSRPIVVMKDPDDNIYYAHNVTSRVDNPFNKRNGYLLSDHQDAGFKKPSIIKCDENNTFVIDPSTLREPFGKLKEEDLHGFLERLEQVREREQKKENEMER